MGPSFEMPKRISRSGAGLLNNLHSPVGGTRSSTSRVSPRRRRTRPGVDGDGGRQGRQDINKFYHHVHRLSSSYVNFSLVKYMDRHRIKAQARQQAAHHGPHQADHFRGRAAGLLLQGGPTSHAGKVWIRVESAQVSSRQAQIES